jgi:penicillin-binding protein 1C
MRKKRRVWRHVFGWMPEWLVLSIIACFALGLFALGGVAAWATFMPIPSIDNFESRQVAESTKIYDRTGNIVLYDVHGNVRRTSVPLEEISPYIQKATIAIEDASFYEHFGFRPLAFLRAVWTNVKDGDPFGGQGGSTITQQVVKNALLTQKKTVTRKLQEIILAIRLERVYTKDEILETYLNESPYGGTIYGVQEASQYFYGVDAEDVNLTQAAYLAALPQAPTRYSPHGNHRDLLEARKNRVLAAMLEHGFITEDEYDQARAEVVQFKDVAEAGIKAPHFVFYVREYLEEKYGPSVVLGGGLKVITTLDYDLQAKAEEIVRRKALENETQFNAENAGLVAIEPSTGQILTMVGSRGYFDDDIDGKVNVTTARRQPGSSFKPFVYATAFEKGYTPETVLFDLKTQFSNACAPSDFTNEFPCYSPENYDHEFRGPISLREALAQSVNIPAVKLVWLAGVEDSIKTAERLGITSLVDAARYGLTLVLGGGEVKLVEMVSAYGVFAHDGLRNPATAILRVEDHDGTALEEFKKSEARVMEPQIAREISDILSDNVARTPLYGSNSPLYFGEGIDVAAKTGTTNDNIDAWVIGYTTSIAAGAWAGNNTPEPMNQISGLIVTPMWREFMDYAIEKYPGAQFTPPAPDPDFDSLPAVLRGEWNANPAEGAHSILYWVRKSDPRSGPPANPASDSQFAYWEYPVRLWSLGQGYGTLPPGQENISSFHILTPAAGTTVSGNLPILVSAYHPHPQNVKQISYYLNDQPIGSSSQAPFAITYVPTLRGPVILRAVVETVTGIETTAVPFTIQ